MPSSRRVLLLACATALCAVHARAFTVPIHDEITRAAIATAVTRVPLSNDQLRRGFTPSALQEIADANRATDTGDCGPGGDDDPVRTCLVEGREDLAALTRLLRNEAPEPEHFDAEQIQQGSDLIHENVRSIQEHLEQRRFTAARKVLGRTLHTLQDFYAHTNWVELGYRRHEARLGTGPNSFMNGTLPRLALPHEPMCVSGQRLLTDLSEQEWIGREEGNGDYRGDHGILTRYQLAEAQNEDTGPISSLILLKVWNDRPLTSGYFFVWGDPSAPRDDDIVTWDTIVALGKSSIEADPEIVTIYGKCRHGYVRGPVLQPGIAKDDPTSDGLADLSRRAGHDVARAIALDHSVRLVVDLLNGIAVMPDGVELLLGLFGYGAPSFETITIGVPGAPGGASWDSALGGILSFNLKGIQPDPRVCFEASPGRGVCTAACEDADWSTDLSAYMCRQPLPLAVRGQRRLRMLIEEVDPTGNQEVANVEVEDPASCDPWCTVDLPGGTLLIRFDGPDSPAVAVPGTNVPQPGSPSPPPSPFPRAPGGGGSIPSRVPTLAEIDTSLGLRDVDACQGADRFFPQATTFAGSPFGRQLGAAAGPIYQLAAFATAIPDAAAKQAVLREIQARVGDDVFLGMMTQVMGDVQQSRALVTAYQNVSRDVAQRIAATGLNAFLPLAPPPGAITGNIASWIGASLSSPGRVAETVDLIAGASQITAECALNQLARDGFAAAIGAR